MIIWIIPAVIIVGILIWLIGIYNKLVRNKNMVEEVGDGNHHLKFILTTIKEGGIR